MSSIPTNRQLSVQLPSLLEKMRSLDSDLRTQALIDLRKELVILTQPSPPSSTRREPVMTYTDEYTEEQLVTMVLKLLNDEIGEVKNEAVACLGVMSRKSRPGQLQTIVGELLAGVESKQEKRKEICCLGLKTAVLEIPVDSQQASQNVESIVTRILGQLTKSDPNPQLASELLQTLTDIYLRFPLLVRASAPLQRNSLSSLTQLLTKSRPSIRKRSIPALSALLATNPELFDPLKSQLLAGLDAKGEEGTIWVGVLASLARGASVGKVGGLLAEGQVVEKVLAQAGHEEDYEAVEGALMTLEVLVLRCPTEVSSYTKTITERALELVKYDPNYAEMSDDDVDMEGDEEEDDDFEDDAYSDDEDVSWKVRRSAAKLLAAIVSTRGEMLLDLLKSVAPVLVSRFNEREESVRLEVLAAFEALLKQTATARGIELAAAGRNKRKRSEEMDAENAEEDSPLTNLRALRPSLLRAILKQLSAKSVPTRQQCFILLRHITLSLDGGLDAEASALCGLATTAIRSVDSATTSSLAMAALSFLSAFFATHSARCFGSHLPQLAPAIARCMKDKLQRISSEAFSAASALAEGVRPRGSASPLATGYSQPVQTLFDATTDVLADPSVDAEVRERALDALGSLLVHEGDVLVGSYDVCLPLITARLTSENTATTAVNVIGRIAASPACQGKAFNGWLLEVLPEVVVALRRGRRSGGKSTEFTCLQSILSRIGSSLPAQTAIDIVNELSPFIDTPTALMTCTLILSQQPACRTAVEEKLLPQVYEIVKTPSTNLTLVEALAAFFGAYVEGSSGTGVQVIRRLVEGLSGASERGKLPDATRGGTGPYATTARCVGAVVERSPSCGNEVMGMFTKTIQSSKASEAEAYLALLCIGEVGRVSDQSGSTAVFDKVLGFFKSDSEELRSAGAFAAGNLAVGSPSAFLPQIVSQISSTDSEATRLLLLHALKEVILHSPPAQLESLADSLWTPLFADEAAAQVKPNGKSKTSAVIGADEIGDDGVRNVKAACIGKLTVTAPAKFLPQLQELLRSSPRNRAIVAAAVRYTFIDTSSAYDELIAPIMVDFLSLMQDSNLIVRRLSLASLNAAIQNKPYLVIDRLQALQPLLFAETYEKKELQREVQMGPWKVIEDDGLENRKTAYETMYTLLGTCANRLDLPTVTDRVLASLKDVNEVKVLGLMLLLRLGQVAPASVVHRLDEAADSLRAIMKDLEVKDDTVKQDLERKEEMQRTTLRTAVPLYRMSTPQQAPAFHAFVGSLLSKNEWREFRDYQV